MNILDHFKETTQGALEDALVEAIHQQIGELRVEEEEAREQGQTEYADGIYQAMLIIADNFGIELDSLEALEEDIKALAEELNEEKPTEG